MDKEIIKLSILESIDNDNLFRFGGIERIFPCPTCGERLSKQNLLDLFPDRKALIEHKYDAIND